MKPKRLILFLCYTLINVALLSQEAEIDYNKFVKETQQTKTGSNLVTVAWWIPVEFWELALSQDKNMSKNDIAEFKEVLKPYVLFAVIDGKMGPFGGITFVPEDSIKNTILLTDYEGNRYTPIEKHELNADVLNLLLVINPILKNIMGQLGENMNFYVFTDIKNKKERVADPYSEGYIHLTFCDKKFTWKTPVGSLLPAKICPVDGEKLNGAWKYCPWHGEKLK